ncbi:MAG: VOC family protein [Methanobacteriota archaeon]
MPAGSWRLRYLYVGSADVDGDLARWSLAPGARVAWDLRAFGARVAAVDLGGDPKLILADHRPAPSCLPVFEVGDLEGAMRDLQARGWAPKQEPFEIPDGPCAVYADASGNEVALFQVARPGAFDSMGR